MNSVPILIPLSQGVEKIGDSFFARYDMCNIKFGNQNPRVIAMKNLAHYIERNYFNNNNKLENDGNRKQIPIIVELPFCSKVARNTPVKSETWISTNFSSRTRRFRRSGFNDRKQ